jgi:putative ABC transport system substrate-binding protein
VRDVAEIEHAVADFARGSNGGMIVTASSLVQSHRDLIVKLAAKHKLPTVCYERSFVTGGGLISYGADFVDQFRRAAGSIVSSRARSQLNCQCRHRPNTS